ncbi:FKBP-type peptidyl-prolyl cis-trans isomerase [Hymenobacter sp. BT770]|uniref:FKBP-type peptidyl-prolyl cis-trans isomerase n=1 Tax=Hymenobacter sp. BT770 TaxID=2886942 RepID=UPI001D11277E|nr:FKBP-type peptidyl-prolyl cis-trans isomerase [Hymenobacter sp. BT770]MCC3151460.1 FKBP-type peptidyl-prolyl cis-trans isomerase [Hymenobacter sp. BT770]MDO3413964.1 FKBP-type peptidyl-prolyl cis-trans isomerase [Hymenobacter sp. BT770]
MSWFAGLKRHLSSLALVLGLWLTAAAASAQPATKPAVPSSPSATGSDTAHLVPQHTRSGVRFVFRERGTGPQAKAGSRVAVRYTGFLPDGHIFDATAASGGPLRFRVGRGEVILGWDELLPLLPVGSRVRAWIPAALAYGATGVRDPDDESRYLIPPNTELVFELQVLSVR